jgi:hypothetical protein
LQLTTTSFLPLCVYKIDCSGKGGPGAYCL